MANLHLSDAVVNRAGENARLIGECQHEIEIVLEDDDREVVAQLVERLEQFLDDGGRQAVERLVQPRERAVLLTPSVSSI